MAMTILLASNNPEKRLELERVLAPLGIAVTSPGDLGIDLAPDECGETFEENAILKAVAFAEHTDLPVLADDSGLVVDELAGAPGVRSARFAGDGADAANRAHLLQQLQRIPAERRSARFVSALALIMPDEEAIVVRGSCEGRILDHERGNGGFGYDPLFLHPDSGRTFAELSAPEKDRVSHRGRALGELVDILSRRRD